VGIKLIDIRYPNFLGALLVVMMLGTPELSLGQSNSFEATSATNGDVKLQKSQRNRLFSRGSGKIRKTEREGASFKQLKMGPTDRQTERAGTSLKKQRRGTSREPERAGTSLRKQKSKSRVGKSNSHASKHSGRKSKSTRAKSHKREVWSRY
jgi:hypothetical protein